MSAYFFQFLKNKKLEAQPLFYDDKKTYTGLDLKNAISYIATQLVDVEAQRIAICIEHRFWFTATLFALLYQEKVPIILGHMQIDRLCENHLFFDSIISLKTFKTDPLSSIKIDPEIPLQESKNSNSHQIFDIPLHNQMLYFYTSGSSGEPHKIIKNFEVLEKESALLIASLSNLAGASHCLATVSPLHQYGLTFNILLPLRLGIKNYCTTISYQEELNKHHHDNHALFITSPAFLKRLDLSLKKENAFQIIFSAGGPLSHKEAIDSYTTFNTYPTEIYGSSETGIIAFRQHNTDEHDDYFHSFAGITIQQQEDNLIHISSPLILEKTITLNDKIKISPQGFKILGRSDKIIKIEEKRISLTEIETRIKKHLPHAEVFIIPLSVGNRIILGAVIAGENIPIHSQPILVKDITRKLKPFVDTIAIPKRWRFIAEAPSNSQGKTTHYSLKDLFNE